MNTQFYKFKCYPSGRELYVRESFISHIVETIVNNADGTKREISQVVSIDGGEYLVEQKASFIVSLTFRTHIVVLNVPAKQRVYIFESSIQCGFDTATGSRVHVGKSIFDIDISVSKLLGSDCLLKM